MKKLFLLLSLSVIFSLSACKSNSTTSDLALVVSDCTGVYLRMDGLDYRVCNSEELKDKKGKRVKVSYKKIESCNADKNKVVCMMYHKNEGLIKIKLLP